MTTLKNLFIIHSHVFGVFCMFAEMCIGISKKNLERKVINSTFSLLGAMLAPVTIHLEPFDWESKTVRSELLKAILI